MVEVILKPTILDIKSVLQHIKVKSF